MIEKITLGSWFKSGKVTNTREERQKQVFANPKNYSFDLEFQEHILAAFLSDPDFTRQNISVIQKEYFGDDTLQGAAEAFVNFFKKHKIIPSKSALVQEVRDLVAPGRKYTEYVSCIQSIYSKLGKNIDYFQTKAVEFAKMQAFADGLQLSMEKVKEGDIDSVKKIIADAYKVGESLEALRLYDYAKDMDSRLKYYSKCRGQDPNRITTGYRGLDGQMRGGLGPGETGMVVALPKHGKTTMLVNLAANAMKAKKRVMYVTLELNKYIISSKFDSLFLDVDVTQLRGKLKHSKSALDKLRKLYQERLFIAQYPAKRLSLPKFESLIQQNQPDIVFIDYLPLLRSPTQRERRFELTEIAEELRGIAGECSIPIWTAYQVNRVGAGVQLIEMQHLAEDFNQNAVHDILISVNWGFEEKRQNLLRLYNMGGRLGESGRIIECDVNWFVSKIEARR